MGGRECARESKLISVASFRFTADRVTKHPVRVMSVEEVQKEKILVLAHPQLGEDFDCHQPGSNILRFGPWRDDEKDDEKDLLVRSHPVRCHSVSKLARLRFRQTNDEADLFFVPVRDGSAASGDFSPLLCFPVHSLSYILLE